MSEPVEGRWGLLLLSGWVALAPTGHDEAFLMITTPDPRAEVTMPLVAAGLGLRVGEVTSTDKASVEIGQDGWATLKAAGDRYARPVNDQWAATAAGRGQVVLVVGTVPDAEGLDPDAYTQRYGGATALGLVPARRV